MEIVPEAVTLGGAALVGFLVAALKQAFAWVHDGRTLAVSIPAGLAVAALVYGAGVVDLDGMSTGQMIARAALAGLTMAMAAGGGAGAYKALPAAVRPGSSRNDPT